jgi:hypothetical protein
MLLGEEHYLHLACGRRSVNKTSGEVATIKININTITKFLLF